MLREIRIRNLGVIADAELELVPGLNVVTGETGAGKTMLVQGLGLLLGSRADTALVRAGSDAAGVEGTVALPPEHPIRHRVEELGGYVEDDLVLARTMTADGRSRAQVAGRATPAGVLAEFGESLVAVHGQADQWRLRRPDQHREALDTFAGATVLRARAAYRRTFDGLEVARRDRDELRARARERTREVEDLTLALEAIDRLAPAHGEDHALRAEGERLANAEALRAAAGIAHVLLSGEGYAGDSTEGAAVLPLLARARETLAAPAAHDPTLAGLRDRLGEAGYLVAELSADLAGYLADLDVDPARLDRVQQRLADLATLTRRQGGDVAAVLAWGQSAAARLDELRTQDERVADLDGQVAHLQERLAQQAERLSAARAEAAARFAEQVSAELAHLAMGSARVEVGVTRRPAPEGLSVGEPRASVAYGRYGVDEVEILLAAGSGMPARSVAKAASGGELSRVMLAIELVLASGSGHGPVETFVFDEVDAGVGGRAAVEVGARLAALAKTAQVLVVTHLAQVAAYADRHLVVSKDDDGLVTESTVAPVDGEHRLHELARMMSGEVTPAALEHAADLVARAAASLSTPRPLLP